MSNQFAQTHRSWGSRTATDYSDTGSDSDKDKVTPDPKRGKLNLGAMSNKRGRRGSQENMNPDLKTVLDAIAGLKTSVESLQGEIVGLKRMQTEIRDQGQTLKRISNEMKEIQIEAKKKWVVIKGLSKHGEARKFETREQTGEVLEDFKRFLKCAVIFNDYMRLPEFKLGTVTMSGVVRVEFRSVDDKLTFFKDLVAASKLPQLKGVSVDQEMPRFLLPEKKRLESKAYDLRHTQQVKTRLVIRKLDLVLQFRSKEEGSKWLNYRDTPDPSGPSTSGPAGAEGGVEY